MYEEKLRSLCPVEPDVIRGKYWNEKVYGKAGRYSIYPDSKRFEISDEEATALKKYLSDRAEYRKTKKKMEEEGFVVPALGVRMKGLLNRGSSFFCCILRIYNKARAVEETKIPVKF